MNTKLCIKCKEIKTLDQFYKLSDNNAKKQCQKDGHDYYCRYCRTGSSLKSHRGGNKKPCSVSLCENSHYAKGMCRNHYTRMHLNGTLEYQMKYRSDDIREAYLRKRYLVTLKEFNEMAINGCQICGDTPKGRPLHIDHDHKCCPSNSMTCGKCVRGVVCNRCNQTIGKYETGLIRDDNPLIDKIKEYLHG
jgi:hypothetical protein